MVSDRCICVCLAVVLEEYVVAVGIICIYLCALRGWGIGLQASGRETMTVGCVPGW